MAHPARADAESGHAALLRTASWRDGIGLGASGVVMALESIRASGQDSEAAHSERKLPICDLPVVVGGAIHIGNVFTGPMMAPWTRQELVNACAVHGRSPSQRCNQDGCRTGDISLIGRSQVHRSTFPQHGCECRSVALLGEIRVPRPSFRTRRARWDGRPRVVVGDLGLRAAELEQRVAIALSAIGGTGFDRSDSARSS